MKPGVSAATTGVLPSRRARKATLSVTAGSVIGPGITSTSAISGTGLKKCIPTTRPGFPVADAMRATGSELVFVARMVVGTAAASRRRNASRLSSRSSGMASITISATASPSSMADVPSRPTAAALPSSVSWPFSTLRARNPAIRSIARSVAPRSGSCKSTSKPASAATCAMPAPIMPAPSTPTVVTSFIGR